VAFWPTDRFIVSFFPFACPDICFSFHAIFLVIRAFVHCRVKALRSNKGRHVKALTSCYAEVPEHRNCLQQLFIAYRLYTPKAKCSFVSYLCNIMKLCWCQCAAGT
jgi:hypothetical protein